jgi:hypothetical protein
MRYLKKTFLVPLVLLLPLLMVSLAQQPKELSIPQRGLGIEIALSKPFYFPAANTKQHLAAFIRVPVKANSEAQAAQISAIKLVPEMIGDKVKVTVSTLSGDTGRIKSCRDWNSLKESPVASYTLSEGEVITVSQLTGLGANFKDGMLTFKTVALKAASQVEVDPVEGGCGCGWCGRLSCCPSAGYCIECSPCGSVCCAPLSN